MNLVKQAGWLLPFVLLFSGVAASLALMGLHMTTQTTRVLDGTYQQDRLFQAIDQLMLGIWHQMVSQPDCYDWLGAIEKKYHELGADCQGHQSLLSSVANYKGYENLDLQFNVDYLGKKESEIDSVSAANFAVHEFLMRAKVVRKNPIKMQLIQTQQFDLVLDVDGARLVKTHWWVSVDN